MMAMADCSGRAEYQISVPAILDKLSIDWGSWRGKRVAIKPNLVCHNAHPLTTDPMLVATLAEQIHERCEKVDIFVIEGAPFGTTQMYVRHGYTSLPYQLIDIDTCGCYYDSKIEDSVLPVVQLPLALKDAILVSCAVLKEHSEAVVTACVKNLVGIVPSGNWSTNGLWKNRLHDIGINPVIKALYKHRPIDLAVLDASIGVRDNETNGTPCNPPLGKMLIGDDAIEVDKAGAKLLGIDPTTVIYLN